MTTCDNSVTIHDDFVTKKSLFGKAIRECVCDDLENITTQFLTAAQALADDAQLAESNYYVAVGLASIHRHTDAEPYYAAALPHLKAAGRLADAAMCTAGATSPDPYFDPMASVPEQVAAAELFGQALAAGDVGLAASGVTELDIETLGVAELKRNYVDTLINLCFSYQNAIAKLDVDEDDDEELSPEDAALIAQYNTEQLRWARTAEALVADYPEVAHSVHAKVLENVADALKRTDPAAAAQVSVKHFQLTKEHYEDADVLSDAATEVAEKFAAATKWAEAIAWAHKARDLAEPDEDTGLTSAWHDGVIAEYRSASGDYAGAHACYMALLARPDLDRDSYGQVERLAAAAKNAALLPEADLAREWQRAAAALETKLDEEDDEDDDY